MSHRTPPSPKRPELTTSPTRSQSVSGRLSSMYSMPHWLSPRLSKRIILLCAVIAQLNYHRSLFCRRLPHLRHKENDVGEKTGLWKPLRYLSAITITTKTRLFGRQLLFGVLLVLLRKTNEKVDDDVVTRPRPHPGQLHQSSCATRGQLMQGPGGWTRWCQHDRGMSCRVELFRVCFWGFWLNSCWITLH